VSGQPARGEPADAQARDPGVQQRRRDPSLAGAPREAPRNFEWLEGATGVRLGLSVIDGLVTVTVDGELDWASLGVVEAVVLEMLERSSLRVELDLRGVACFGDEASAGDETSVLVSRVQARARRRRVPFVLSTPPPGVGRLRRSG
jgi:hypothetical protein